MFFEVCALGGGGPEVRFARARVRSNKSCATNIIYALLNATVGCVCAPARIELNNPHLYKMCARRLGGIGSGGTTTGTAGSRARAQITNRRPIDYACARLNSLFISGPCERCARFNRISSPWRRRRLRFDLPSKPPNAAAAAARILFAIGCAFPALFIRTRRH